MRFLKTHWDKVLIVIFTIGMLAYYVNDMRKEAGVLWQMQEMHRVVVTGQLSPDQRLDHLTASIETSEKWLQKYRRKREIKRGLAVLYSDRAVTYYSMKRYEDAMRDVERESQIFKDLGDDSLYVSSSCFHVQLLREAGKWEEAIALCHRLITEVGPEEVGYRPYELLVNLTKKSPDPAPEDVAQLDHYRSMATLLSHGDWKEEE